ncbi:hypothetical protein [Marinitoga lauensis]|uniref:hypothetical protein n=1 Tax=Marinitoga lauensis TaxID=2201189 RepID=UPI001012A1C1|nr:hypothetical protein [Marinitoga lauensis]
MIDHILSYLENRKESLSTDDIKRKFNLTDQEWNIVFPFLISKGIKINSFDSLNLKCSDCPIKNYCNKKRCGG